MGRITKRAYKLCRRRELIYFDDADTTLATERGPTARARPSAGDGDHAPGRADRRMDLDRRRPAEPGISAARRTWIRLPRNRRPTLPKSPPL